MEEHRTRRALDELADLFLTGPGGGPPHPGQATDDASAHGDPHRQVDGHGDDPPPLDANDRSGNELPRQAGAPEPDAPGAATQPKSGHGSAGEYAHHANNGTVTRDGRAEAHTQPDQPASSADSADVTTEGEAVEHASPFDLEPMHGFDLDGPAPIRLPPKARPVTSAPTHPHMSHPSDSTPPPAAPSAVFEELAGDVKGDAGDEAGLPWYSALLDSTATESPPQLRLHRDDETGSADAANAALGKRNQPPAGVDAAPTASVETVMLGNLPGLSGPWLTQYAQRLAQREGPVLMLHLDEQGVDMELVEPTDRPQTPGRVPPRGQARDLVDRLETLVRLAPHPVRRVLVHVEASTDPAVLTRLRGFDVWTLLTGCDDAAIVAAYRLIKGAIETDPAVTPRRIGVMMMGSDDDSACRGIARLRSAAGSFLDSPIELVGAQRQMVPVNLRQLGRFEPLQAVWPPLRRWLAGLEPAEVRPAVEGDRAVAAQPPVEATAAGTTASGESLGDDDAISADESRERVPSGATSNHTSEPTPAMAAAHESDVNTRTTESAGTTPADPPRPEPAAAHSTPSGPPPASEPAPPRADDRSGDRQSASMPMDPPAAAPASAPAAASATATGPGRGEPSHAPLGKDAPDLAAFLTDDSVTGGVALEARCPHQPATQLLLDQDGRLHLLRRHDADCGLVRSADRSSDDLPTLRRAIVELLEARAWVREHVDLLQLTQRQCRFDRTAEPVLHLFTPRADLATALVARLGPMLKLHLLQRVGQGEHATWFSTPLS